MHKLLCIICTCVHVDAVGLAGARSRYLKSTRIRKATGL